MLYLVASCITSTLCSSSSDAIPVLCFALRSRSNLTARTPIHRPTPSFTIHDSPQHALNNRRHTQTQNINTRTKKSNLSPTPTTNPHPRPLRPRPLRPRFAGGGPIRRAPADDEPSPRSSACAPFSDSAGACSCLRLWRRLCCAAAFFFSVSAFSCAS